MRAKTLSFIISILLIFCSNASSQTQITAKQKLDQVIAKEAIYRQKSNPFNQPEVGGNNAKLPDLSPEKLKNNNQKLTCIYEQLQDINIHKLAESDQINWAVLTYSIKNELDNYHFKARYMPLTAESGFHVWIANINNQIKMLSKQDFLDYLSRLKAIPVYFDQQMAWMDKGIASGITQPQVVLIGFEQSIKAFIKKDITKSSYYTPFIHLPHNFSPQFKANLRNKAKLIIKQSVMPSYEKYYHYMTERYQPNARKNISASSLPNGDAFYKNRVAYYTTTSLSPDKIYNMGLKEVDRIHLEMMAVIKEVGFKGTFSAFIHFLRTDPRFYAKTPLELLKDASYIAKQMDGKLPSLFKTLPRTPYGIAPVPKNIAPKYTTGRYSPPTRADQAGSYWVNTYRLDRRPLYVLEALTFHEAVPGHHLQGSIAREMKNVPEFRKNTYISAFGEGWGLYSEFLGVEAGFYQDPYSKFGRLTYEMWRACRLVVDVGMHAKGWTRTRAMNYLAQNTALSLHNVKTEIDRYISWPGQALSYKIGELTIKRLRKEAEQQLGSHFDLREFHDQLLKNGSMPLSMLEQVIDNYIKQKQAIIKSKVVIKS